MSKWIPSFGAVPVEYHYEIGCLENVSEKAVIRNNLRGEKLRVTFANPDSPDEMRIEAAAIALRDRVSGKKTPDFPLTCGGSGRIVLAPGEERRSDEVCVPVSPEDDFILKLYFKERTVLRSALVTWRLGVWQCSQFSGDFRSGPLGFTVKQELCPGLAADPYPNHFLVGVKAVSVYAEDGARLMGLMGDSVTHMGFFSDPLILALYEKYPGRLAVINAGICGNRIARDYPRVPVSPGEGHQFGAAGRDRFLRDLYSEAAPDDVFIMEGVNDCTHWMVSGTEPEETPEGVFAALSETAAQAGARGSRVLMSTIMPFGADGMPWRDRADAIRRGCNDLIRARVPAESLVDLDAVMRDPDDPSHLQEGMHLGDGVHPNDFGGCKMARAVMGRWFT